MKSPTQSRKITGRKRGELTLGLAARRIIEELSLGGKLLESWMANHVAELILSPKNQAPDDKIEKLILALWDRKLAEQALDVLKAVEQQTASSGILSTETLGQLSQLVSAPKRAKHFKREVLLNRFSELQVLEGQFLYLWLLLEGLEKNVNAIEQPSIIILMNNESILGNWMKKLKGFDSQFDALTPENTQEIKKITLRNWIRTLKCRSFLLEVIAASHGPEENSQKSRGASARLAMKKEG
jgi:hypothetical protein